MFSPNGIYTEFLSDLEKAGVPYAILRDDLTGGVHIRDLDILIDSRERATFHEVARRHSFILIKDEYLNPSKNVYLRIAERDAFLVDVHEKMIYRGIEFMNAEILIRRSRKIDGYYRLSDEDFVMSLLFHNVFAKRQIQEKHRKKILQLLQRPLDDIYIDKHLQEFGLSHIFRQLKQDFDAVCKNEELLRRHARRATFGLLLRRPGNLVRVLTMRARRYSTKVSGKRRGALIAFIGPDGAGKSTTIEAVEQRLRDLGLACATVYLGPWGQNLLHFRKIFRGLNPNPYREDYEAYYSGRRSDKPGPLTGVKRLKLQVRSTLYYTLLIIEMWVRWIVRVLPPLRQGKVVLTDRYIYDILAGYKTRPMDYHVGIRTLICDTYPKPDIGIVLDSNPEIIFERKSQLNHNQLIEARVAYSKIAIKYKFEFLDTSINISETLNTFEEKIVPKILLRISMNKES
jgi:thymidylate kinase